MSLWIQKKTGTLFGETTPYRKKRQAITMWFTGTTEVKLI